MWGSATTTLAILLIAGGLAWALFGLDAALIVLLLCMIGLFVLQLRGLVKLVNWSRDPVGTPTPRAFGLWDYVFTNLARRTRVAYDQRERLAQALSRFREASQAMPDGVVYLSYHNLIEWINVAAGHHFGLDGERDIGAAITNLVRNPDFVRYIEAEQYSEPLILKTSRPDGLLLAIQIVPFGEDQKMILSRDITQLEKLETMRRDFVANVSHELKTPLTVVNGFAETLLDGLEDFTAEEARRYLQLVLDQSGRMQRLIDDLLALSALETAGGQPQDESVDAQGLVRTIVQEAQILSGGRHEIEVDLGEAARLTGNPKELHSAMANLASNAVRYTPDGGHITLRWHVEVDGSATFSVRDSGIGIDPQHLPRLTERFYRVDRGRSRETGGTGLGLAIVKHILTRHQATLEIKSAPGQGSTFSAHFPAARVQAAARVTA
ncbi:MAG: phosphate regulon sensor histidine kinase PhoR [Rhodocyclaceae bacterium]